MKDAKEAKNIILKAALDELAEVGIGRARTSSIAKRAGVTTGLLHYHFGTKENLIKEIIRHALDTSLLNDIVVVPYHRKCSPVEKIQVILYSILEYNFRKSTHNTIRLFHHLMAEGKEFINKITQDYDRTVEKYIIKIIEQGNKEKIFDVKYPSYFSIELSQTVIQQMSAYFIFEGSPGEEFFPFPFRETYSDYYVTTSLKKIMRPDKLHEIKKIPDDLKQIVDTYIDVIAEREIISSWYALIRLISKLFNDEHLLTGEN